MYEIGFYTFGECDNHDREVLKEEYSENLFNKYGKKVNQRGTIYLKKIYEIKGIKKEDISIEENLDKKIIYRLYDMGNFKHSLRSTWLLIDFATKMIKIFSNRVNGVVIIIEKEGEV